MKLTHTIAAAALATSSFFANAGTIISSRTVTLPVDISTAKVVFTNKGYGRTYLVKVLVPTLAGPTLMNHRNDDESAPCLATYQTRKVEDIVQGRPEIVYADMQIDLEKTTSVSDNLCRVFLTENITTVIRGFTFVHSRTSELPSRNPADCE